MAFGFWPLVSGSLFPKASSRAQTRDLLNTEELPIAKASSQ